MAIIDWFRRAIKLPNRPTVDLETLQAHWSVRVPVLQNQIIDRELLLAQLADHYRAIAVLPPLPEEMTQLTADLGDEDWRRFALVVSSLENPYFRNDLRVLLGDRGSTEQIRETYVGTARDNPLLTMELLHQSHFRIEELARSFLARLGASIEGESDRDSLNRLQRLDYAALLAEAERAKESAEERMAYIRQLEEEQESRRPRRGKW